MDVTKPVCETCGGTGWLLYAHTINRCDDCHKFKGDLEAATEFFKSPKGQQYWLDEIVVSPKHE